MQDYMPILENEFSAGDGSFLIQLRGDLQWDKAAFTRLITAMADCCRDRESEEMLERWVAEGFWYVPNFVNDWTSHPNFRRPHEAEYYEKAHARLDDLASWYFTGRSPYMDGRGFEPM